MFKASAQNVFGNLAPDNMECTVSTSVLFILQQQHSVVVFLEPLTHDILLLS